MATVFASNLKDRVRKDIPQIQLDRTNRRMQTMMMNRKTVNPLYVKRKILDDGITTRPLQKTSDGSFI
jgi:hypothetical protein